MSAIKFAQVWAVVFWSAVHVADPSGPRSGSRLFLLKSVVFQNMNIYNKGMYDLTGFQRDLLYVIAGLDDPHGLAIKDELEDYYEKEIHHGRLYPNLDTLVEKGLVEKSQRDRRTNEYTTTRRGTRELEARAEWEGQYIDHDD